MAAQMSSATFTWKSDPSAGPIPAHVYLSDTATREPRPIALMFHAGGFVLGSTDMIPKKQITFLVQTGFVVVTPEYRLCPQASLYDGPIQDAKDVLAWCQKDLPPLMAEKDIQVNGTKVVTMGHSAGGMLALVTGTCPSPPLAIVDFYGCKSFSDPSWFQPLPAFAQMPHSPGTLTSQIFSGPQALTSAPMFVGGAPNLADPRCAWYIAQIKAGTSISSIVPDGDYARVDPTTQFNEKFPPTYFLHGTKDVFVKCELTERAHDKLKGLGVKTELVAGEEIGHAFDLNMEEGSELWGKYVVPALEFLGGFA